MISSTGSTFEKSMTWFVPSFCEIAVLRLRLHRRGHPIAAGVLYPIFGVLLSPIIAAAAMALSSVSVIANAIRLRTIRL